jgi:peptide/nickel transport system permease protein
LLLAIPTLFGISILVFALMRLLPGNIVDVLIGTEVSLTPEQRETLTRLLGIDMPIHEQYLRWIQGVLRFDLGVSLRSSEPVAGMILKGLGMTGELALLSIALAVVVAVPLGILSAIKRHGLADFVAHLGGLIGLSVPNFWLATMLLLLTSVVFQWQPALIWVSPFQHPAENLKQMLLPVLSLSVALIAAIMRMTRSSMLEVLGREYIRTATAKGLREGTVVTRHAMKNAAIPVVTIIGLQVGHLLGGAVVIEQIFGLPGIGWLILNGIYQRDYPVVQGGVLFVASSFVFVNLVIDMLYAYMDPRIRYT